MPLVLPRTWALALALALALAPILTLALTLILGLNLTQSACHVYMAASPHEGAERCQLPHGEERVQEYVFVHRPWTLRTPVAMVMRVALLCVCH